MSNGHTYKRLALWATRLGRELRRKVHGGGYLLVHRLGEDDPTEHVNLLEVDKRLRRLQKRLRGVPPTEGHPKCQEDHTPNETTRDALDAAARGEVESWEESTEGQTE